EVAVTDDGVLTLQECSTLFRQLVPRRLQLVTRVGRGNELVDRAATDAEVGGGLRPRLAATDSAHEGVALVGSQPHPGVRNCAPRGAGIIAGAGTSAPLRPSVIPGKPVADGLPRYPEQAGHDLLREPLRVLLAQLDGRRLHLPAQLGLLLRRQ